MHNLDNPLNDTVYVWPMNNLTYVAEIIDTNGCSNIDSVYVTVNSVVPTFAGNGTSICLFDSIAIGGFPTSPFGTTYSWNTSPEQTDATATARTVV